jgi:hypothetical protein
LGAIGTGDALAALESLLTNTKNPDYTRTLAAETLLKNNADQYADAVIAVMDEAQKDRRTGVYNGCLNALAKSKTGKLEALARRYFESGTAAEKSAALDIARDNKFTSLRDEVTALTDKKNGSLAAKAEKVLESWN